MLTIDYEYAIIVSGWLCCEEEARRLIENWNETVKKELDSMSNMSYIS